MIPAITDPIEHLSDLVHSFDPSLDLEAFKLLVLLDIALEDEFASLPANLTYYALAQRHPREFAMLRRLQRWSKHDESERDIGTAS